MFQWVPKFGLSGDRYQYKTFNYIQNQVVDECLNVLIYPTTTSRCPQ